MQKQAREALPLPAHTQSKEISYPYAVITACQMEPAALHNIISGLKLIHPLMYNLCHSFLCHTALLIEFPIKTNPQ